MFMCTAVTRIERERLAIMRERRLQLAQTAISVPDIVLDISVLWVTQRSERERRDRAMPIAGAQCLLACHEIGIELRPVRAVADRAHGRADRPRFEAHLGCAGG